MEYGVWSMEYGVWSMEYKGFRDLIVYQKPYKAALEIFAITKTFPKEEQYSLTDQIRRSSRSVPANIAEAWRKRKYSKLFVSKLIDSSGEASETEVWLDMSKDLNYGRFYKLKKKFLAKTRSRKMFIIICFLCAFVSSWRKKLNFWNRPYIQVKDYNSLNEEYEEISKMLNSMINHPEKFCVS